MENNHFKKIEEILVEMRMDAEKSEIKRDIAGSFVNVVKEKQNILLIRYIKLLTAVSVLLIMGNIIQGMFLIQRGQEITKVQEAEHPLTDVFIVPPASPEKSSAIATVKIEQVDYSETPAITEEANISPESGIEEIFKLYSLISGFPSIQEIMSQKNISEQTKGGSYDRV